MLILGVRGQRLIAIEEYLLMMEQHQEMMCQADCQPTPSPSAPPVEAWSAPQAPVASVHEPASVQQEAGGIDCDVETTDGGGAEGGSLDVQPVLRAAQQTRSQAHAYLLECAQVQGEHEKPAQALEKGEEPDGEGAADVAWGELAGAQREEEEARQEGQGEQGGEGQNRTEDGDDLQREQEELDADGRAGWGKDGVLGPNEDGRGWVVTPVKGVGAFEKPDVPGAAGGMELAGQQEDDGMEKTGAEGQQGGGEAQESTPDKEVRRRHCFILGIPTTPPRVLSAHDPAQAQNGAHKLESNAGGYGRDGRPQRRWIVDAKLGTRWDCAPSLLGGMRSGVLDPATGYAADVTAEGQEDAGVHLDEAAGDGKSGRACGGVHLPSTPTGARKSASNAHVSRVRTTQFVTEALAAHSRDARRVCLRAQGFVTPNTKDRVDEWIRLHVPLGEDHLECRSLFGANSDSPCKPSSVVEGNGEQGRLQEGAAGAAGGDGACDTHTSARDQQSTRVAHCEAGGGDGDEGGSDAETCDVDSLRGAAEGSVSADDADAMRREGEDKLTPLKSDMRCGVGKGWARDALDGDLGDFESHVGGDVDGVEDGQIGQALVPCTGIIPYGRAKMFGFGGLGAGGDEEDEERWWEAEGEWGGDDRAVDAGVGSRGRNPKVEDVRHVSLPHMQDVAQEESAGKVDEAQEEEPAEEVEEELIYEEVTSSEEEEEEEYALKGRQRRACIAGCAVGLA